MPIRTPLRAAATALTLAALAPAGVAAQDGAQYTDEQIGAFADAAMEVRDLNAEYVGKLEQADGEAEQRALIEEANERMRVAIEETPGITVEEYQAIGRAAQNDSNLAARISEELSAE